MDATTGLDTTPVWPDLMSKTTKISQSKTKLTGSESHRAMMFNGILFRMLLSYASFASMLLLDEHLNSAAGASPAAAVSSQPTRVKELPPVSKRTTSLPAPATAPRGSEATAPCRDTSDFDIELEGRPRTGQVSPHVCVALPPVILTFIAASR
jgi:hypothetical protein